MNCDDVREIFETVLPQADIEKWADELGVVKRDRKLDVVALVRALVISAGTPTGGIQADALRAYIDYDVKPVARGAFYAWFTESLERLMERISAHAQAFALVQEVDLPGPLAGVTDWRIVDSETVKAARPLESEFPGCGDYAAIKIHKTFSVGTGCAISYHFSPAKDHDSPHLTIDESWRGYGLLVDLGYASHDRLRDCEKHGVRFVIRLKENWKAKVESISRGRVTGTFFAGTDLDVLLHDEVLRLDGKVIDAEVTLGTEGEEELRLRLIGIPTPKGYCFFLTNLSKRVGPLQVGNIYRIRWEIELNNKLDKSVNRLDESQAERPCSIKTLLHAAIVGSILTNLIVHKHSLETRPKKPAEVRTKPPLHPILLGRALAQASLSLAQAFELTGSEAKKEWQRIAEKLVRWGEDPNWRRRPSVLDEMRGWKRHPLPKKGGRTSSGGKRNAGEGSKTSPDADRTA